MLGSTLTRTFRARRYGHVLATLENPTDWTDAREATECVELRLFSLHFPLCILVGQARMLTYADVC